MERENTRVTIDQIYTNARIRQKIEAHEMVTDITGSVRAVNLGATLACLDRSRDVQLMQVDYDKEGKPLGEPTAVIFRFGAQVKE